MAAACAPAMARLILDDLPTSVAFDLGVNAEMEPGFKENGSRGSGSGNFTGKGLLTGDSPLTAAS